MVQGQQLGARTNSKARDRGLHGVALLYQHTSRFPQREGFCEASLTLVKKALRAGNRTTRFRECSRQQVSKKIDWAWFWV